MTNKQRGGFFTGEPIYDVQFYVVEPGKPLELGEKDGTLDDILNTLEDERESDQKARGKPQKYNIVVTLVNCGDVVTS